MALNSFMELKLGTSAGSEGTALAPEYGYDTQIRNMGSEDVAGLFQVLSFEAEVTVGVAGSGSTGSQAQSGRRHEPWRIQFLVGKMFPEIFRGATMNNRVDLTLKMFVENHDSGVTELLHTAKLNQGRIVALKLVCPNVLNPETLNLPIYGEMLVVGHTYTHTTALGGGEHVDASDQRGSGG